MNRQPDLAQASSRAGIVVAVGFSETRPSTVLGGAQGDHASAYSLFKQIIIANIVGSSFEEATRVILTLIDSYSTNRQSQEIFEKVKSQIKSIEQELGTLHGVLQKKNLAEDERNLFDSFFEKHRVLYFEKLLDELISMHLVLRNKLEMATVSVEFNKRPPEGEPARIRAAIARLRQVKPENVVAELEIIKKSILDLIWYPKLGGEELFDSENSHHVSQWAAIKKKKAYRAAVVPRSNDLDDLCQILELHLDLIFHSFPVLREHSNEQQRVFIDRFLGDFLSSSSAYEHSWKLSDADFLKVTHVVLDNLKNVYEIGVESAKHTSSEEAKTTSSEEDGSKRVSSGSGSSDDYLQQLRDFSLRTDEGSADPSFELTEEERGVSGSASSSIFSKLPAPRTRAGLVNHPHQEEAIQELTRFDLRKSFQA